MICETARSVMSYSRHYIPQEARMRDALDALSIADLPIYTPVRAERLLLQRLAFALSVLIPALGAIAAPIVSMRLGFSWVEPTTFLVMLLITGLGIEAGYHRLFSHGSWKTTETIRALMAVAGNMAIQGPVLYWVTHHRVHHPHADKPLDPHSPLDHPRGRVVGFLHAHVGWFFNKDRACPGRFSRDLLSDRTIMAVNRLNPLWVLLSVALPTAIGGVGTMSLRGALAGFLWGGLARICFGQHFTYLINSACHIWGTTPFPSRDHAGNVWWLVLPTFGAGLHNNHHAFPGSATYDFRWWHFDPSGWFIRALASMRLAWDLRRPAEEMIAGKKYDSGRD
jgi:stearoyl-CoA desaturase (delta-9 desaturase)